MEYTESYSPMLKAIVAALFIGFTVVMYGLTLNRKRSKLPPGPFPWPLVGNLMALGAARSPHEAYVKLAERYGNIFCVYMGSARAVVVTNAAMAKELLSVSDLKFASRPLHDIMYTAGKYRNADNSTSMTISHWTPKVREMRQICDRQLLAPRKLEATRSMRREEVWRLAVSIKKVVNTRKPVEIRPLVNELAVRLVCRTLFNKAFLGSEVSADSGLSPEKFHEMDTMLTQLLASPNPSDVIPALRPFDAFGIDKKWSIVNSQLDTIATQVTDWYRKEAPNPDLQDEAALDFVEILMRLAKEGKLTEANINALNCELLLAGADTTSATVEWAMLELMRHPDMMQKLRAEIDEKYGQDSPVDEESALELPYLQAVVKETIRLHHPAPLAIPHCNTEDSTLAGYQIPAGTSVVLHLWAIGRDREQWGQNASEFYPDRFLEREFNINGTSFQFLPFGAGRRICPGRAMAMRSLSLAIGALVHAFDWSLLPGVKELSVVEEVGGLNLRNETPLVLQPSVRAPISLYTDS